MGDVVVGKPKEAQSRVPLTGTYPPDSTPPPKPWRRACRLHHSSQLRLAQRRALRGGSLWGVSLKANTVF